MHGHVSRPHAGQNHYIMTDNKSFERVEQYKYLGLNIRDQNCIHGEIKSRVKSGNAYCYSVQNLLSSNLLSKNVKIVYTYIVDHIPTEF